MGWCSYYHWCEDLTVAGTALSKCAFDPVFRFSSLHSNAMLIMSDTGPYPESSFSSLFLLSPPFLPPPKPISREQLICLFLIAF